jgi:tripartite-type tricarboxylate transporter receptor subunit TctC
LLVYNNTLWTEGLIQKTPYDVLRDFAPVTQISQSPNVLVVTTTLPVNSVADLVALAKAKPGALTYATGSTGASNHVAGEMFKAMAGVDMLRIPYKNGTLQAADLIAGRVQLMFASIGMVPHIKAGRLRAIAVTSAGPSELFPGLPTMASTGLKGYESGSIYAIFAPLRTPSAIVRQLSNAAGRVLQSPEMKQRYLTAGMESVGSSPEELAALIKADLARVGKIAHLMKVQE